MTNIAFIGGGNMASCIIGGMLANGFTAQQIRVSDPGAQARSNIQETHGIAATADNHVAVTGADIVILAVKPQVLGPVVTDLARSLSSSSAVVSIAAGIQIADLQAWLGDSQAIVRAMPNTPAMVRQGATGLFANPHINSQQKDSIASIFNAVGIACWVDSEAQIDAVTAVSGSGPAYYFFSHGGDAESSSRAGAIRTNGSPANYSNGPRRGTNGQHRKLRYNPAASAGNLARRHHPCSD